MCKVDNRLYKNGFTFQRIGNPVLGNYKEIGCRTDANALVLNSSEADICSLKILLELSNVLNLFHLTLLLRSVHGIKLGLNNLGPVDVCRRLRLHSQS